MMSDIFSTSCSYKPKEYDPEHEVCLKGILLSTQEKEKKKKKVEPFFCLPPQTSFTWGSDIHFGLNAWLSF